MCKCMYIPRAGIAIKNMHNYVFFSMQEMFPIYFHILLALTSFTTAAVYYVEPDDGESCPYQHCHVLQYYANKLLDSYSQLHFLSGTFHLSSDFVLSNAHNISLTGSRAAKSTTPSTIIQCKLSASIAVINTTGLIIRDMVIKNCGPNHCTRL